MPALRSTKSRWLSPAALLLVTAMLAQWSQAADIKVSDVSSMQMHGKVHMNARLDFELSEEALKALDHGVALNIIVDMQVHEQRRWLWDRSVAKHSENFRLERQALSNNYLVTHKYRRRTFLSLQEALQFIGTLRNYPLLDVSKLEADKTYHGRIRAWLDIESLPAPMRPTAYLSASWRIASGWVEWPIQS